MGSADERIAFLDIETTGLSPSYCDITVAGIGVKKNGKVNVVQLVGKDITARALEEALGEADTIYTFNGKRFDVSFIRKKLGVNLESARGHRDLMYECWRRNLYGGLKAVERKLGIGRNLPDLNGLDAVRLWESYLRGSESCLETLLAYNREDVVNLDILRLRLEAPGPRRRTGR